MISCIRTLLLLLAFWSAPAVAQSSEMIPLPEHPRPDFQRPDWINLNGTWAFRFDSTDVGLQGAWYQEADFPERILVPFPWGSPLSGVADEAEIGWYARSIEVPADWQGRRVFVTIGASDWHTTAWLDGHELGTHQGGYTPFSFELTPHVRPGEPQQLVLRVDDAARAFKLEGKQGYGNARGLWQTPYLEARGGTPIDALHVTPDIHTPKVTFDVRLLEPASEDLTLRLVFDHAAVPEATQRIAQGAQEVSFDVPMPNARRWSLEDPFLYEVTATVEGPSTARDHVKSYFGMREISVVDLPGAGHPYVALNGEPVYLQLALDQAYHPEGFYTFPSDTFIRDEVLRARQIGLNGLRVHVKIGHPRKLYWADRLGMLIMADVPNSWGEPTPEMRQEVEYALRQMIQRDYNHPSIFAWVPFNETWGLFTEVPKPGSDETERRYLPETQEWVVSIYHLAKSLDPTRLVEDNSVCCGRGHTETDLNSWHDYLPGWAWEERLDAISRRTAPDSTWNFEAGYHQGRQPMLNSEFGNVWGYEGSTGDVDWSWDYHRALDAFRRHPKVAGWLYTEHHDVINEWNGYWRFDRSEKITGLDELVGGMTLADLHAPLYIAPGGDLSREVTGGETVEVPLFASFLTGSEALGDTLTLRVHLHGWDALGQARDFYTTARPVPYRPWIAEPLPALAVPMPDETAIAVLALTLEDAAGQPLHRNFTTFVVRGASPGEIQLANGKTARLLRFAPADFADASWSLKQWNVLDGLKVNGAGAGHFTYRVPWPSDLDPGDVESALLVFEASAKQLFGKDRADAGEIAGDYMLGRGTFDPSRNPNAYPMTDETRFPSAVQVHVNGTIAGRAELHDDPADHRGILSWHAQPRDRRLREAGSYGQLVQVALPPSALQDAAETGTLEIRLDVPDALPGGLALYGARFGRYPLDPTLVFTLRDALKE